METIKHKTNWNPNSAPPKANIIGLVFGFLTVEEELPDRSSSRAVQYRCTCECGGSIIISASKLLSGQRKWCRDCKGSRLKGLSMSKSRERNILTGMISRCYNKNIENYLNYGGRGIKVCDRWLKFKNFFCDMGFSNGLSIERIDNNGNYEPENCRWATVKEQSRNRRTNVLIEYNGQTKLLADWAEESVLKKRTFLNRYYMGWSFDQIMNTPLRIQ